MNKETFEQERKKIYNFREKLGEVMYDAINEWDNFPRDMAKYAIDAFLECETEREFQIANNMLTAICGWGIDTLIERIEEKDADPNFYWESCEKEDWDEDEEKE